MSLYNCETLLICHINVTHFILQNNKYFTLLLKSSYIFFFTSSFYVSGFILQNTKRAVQFTQRVLLSDVTLTLHAQRVLCPLTSKPSQT
jgi:hypothetical protein